MALVGGFSSRSQCVEEVLHGAGFLRPEWNCGVVRSVGAGGEGAVGGVSLAVDSGCVNR